MGNFDNFKWTDPGYEKMRAKAIALAQNINGSQVTEALNKSGAAGGMSGIANTGGLAADTLSRFADSRSRNTLDAFNQYTLPALASQDNFNQMKAQMDMQAEANKPGVLDWISAGIGAVAPIINPLASLGYLDNLFGDVPTKVTKVGNQYKIQGGGRGQGGNKQVYPGRLPGRGRQNNLQNLYDYVPIDPRYGPNRS